MVPRIIQMMDAALSQSSPSKARESVLKSLMRVCDSVICTQTIDLNAFISGRHREYLYAVNDSIIDRVVRLNPTWLRQHPFFQFRPEFTHRPYELMNYGEVLNERYFDSDYFIQMHKEAGLSRTSAYTFSPRIPDGKPLWGISFIIEGRIPSRRLLNESKKLFSIMPMLDNVFGNLEYWDDLWIRDLAFDELFRSESRDALVLVKNGRIEALTNVARNLICIDDELANHPVFVPLLIQEVIRFSRVGGGSFPWRAPNGCCLNVSALRQDAYTTLVRIGQKPSSDLNKSGRLMKHYNLTLQECRILRLVAEGAGNRSIARTMNLSIFTIKTYLRHIFQKLRARNRSEACRIWLQHL